MKNLANCTPEDFLKQTNKIRHAAAGWLRETGVLEIRKRQPVFTGKETPEEKKAMINAQAKKNIDAMLDELLENHAEETVKLFGMMSFLTPEEAAQVKSLELIASGLEILNSKEVMDFLALLMRLAQINTAS